MQRDCECMRYAFFDGDDVSNIIEILFIENKVESAASLSGKLKSTVQEIEELLNAQPGVDVILSGGDEMLIRYDPTVIGITFLENIRRIFVSKTGISLSCGVGISISESIHNLRLAKLYGKNQTRGAEN